MKKRIAVVFYYHRSNKYSFNALAGALETYEGKVDFDLYFVSQQKSIFETLKSLIPQYDKIILGISILTPQRKQILWLVNQIRKEFGDAIILISGGPHATANPAELLQAGFNFVFLGESEASLVSFIDKMSREVSCADLESVALLDDKGQICVNKRNSIVDLDKSPPFSLKHRRFGPIEITRGCPFRCFFCQTSFIFGTALRHRSIEKICEYVKILIQANFKDIRFISPNALSYGSIDKKTINLPKLTELLENVKKIAKPRGRIYFGTFPSEIRPEHINEDTIKLIKEYADNDNLIIGAQSGSQKILDSCHRGNKVEDIYHAVELTINAGLKANVDFIFGFPDETEQDIALSITLINNLLNMGAKIHAHTFIPLPGTPYHKLALDALNPHLRAELVKLSSTGKLYGQWQAQEKLRQNL